MKIYLVGGAVRDKLLGFPVKERDWVVVGATPEEMLIRGFKSVGKDFPVFLEPHTKEEYALARIERKVGRGYTGFDFTASQQVTLQEDLKRRDLTINAMAEDSEGRLIDYYGGADDLKRKQLRHVSPAFVEDPVRILRVARFAARYHHLGFSVAPETITLMKQMVESQEIDALVAERVWKELERALGEKNPEIFFRVLNECGALDRLFPELNAELGSEALFLGEKFLIKAVQATEDKTLRFAALLAAVAAEGVQKLCERYRIPTEYRELALHRIVLAIPTTAEKILQLLTELDAFRREERFLKIMSIANILGVENISQLSLCYQAAKTVTAEEFLQQGFKGKELGVQIYLRRQEKIAQLLERKCV